MKHATKRLLALFIALLLAMPGMAMAEDPSGDANGPVINGDATPETDGVEATLGDDDAPQLPDDDDPQPPEALSATYWFTAGDALYAEVVVGDGEEIVPPEDPEARRARPSRAGS